DIFRAVGEEYSAAHSDARYFTSGSWKLLQIDLPGSAGAADKPLRIDPVTYPAVIDIAEMALKRPSTGEILWAATRSTEFAALTVGGTACRLAHESYLRILSFGNDPQLLLPQSTTALGDLPLRLELSILVDASPEAIRTALMEMQQEPRMEVPANNAEPQRLNAHIEERSSAALPSDEHLKQHAEIEQKMSELQRQAERIEQISPAVLRSEEELK